MDFFIESVFYLIGSECVLFQMLASASRLNSNQLNVSGDKVEIDGINNAISFINEVEKFIW